MGSFGLTGFHDTAKAKGPGVTIGRSGASIGVVSFTRDDYWPLNTALYVIDFHGNDERFAYYFLKSLDLARLNSGSAQPSLNRNFVHPMKVRVPEVEEQRQIAEMLGALDDKIELNRRMNETLEAMARAIFKSWFVDFDPVRAKSEGRKPVGMDEATAALFPNAFQPSPLGPIPKGWSVGTFSDLCELTIGGDWGDDKPFDGAIEAACLRGVDLEHLKENGTAEPPLRWVSVKSQAQREMNECDVLVAGSGAGPTGRSLWISRALKKSFVKPLIYSNFCKRFRSKSSAEAAYVDRCLQSMRQSGEIWDFVNGTSVPNLDAKGLLTGKDLVIPDPTVLEAFKAFLEPINNILFSGESTTLADLRDTLLPKLLSGELTVGGTA